MLGSHALDINTVSMPSISKCLERFLDPRTVYANPFSFDCLVELYRLLDFFDACKGGGCKRQGKQIDTIGFGITDDPLNTRGIMGG